MLTYLPLLIMFAIALVFAGAFVGLSALLGPKRPTRSKLSVYECGVTPVGNARERFSVKFYLVAILFIIFDVEIVFMYPWAVYYREAVGQGFGEYFFAVMALFFVILILGLIYEWRKGALDWSKR